MFSSSIYHVIKFDLQKCFLLSIVKIRAQTFLGSLRSKIDSDPFGPDAELLRGSHSGQTDADA